MNAENLQPSLLLADDDTTFCEVMSRVLRRRGFEVGIAHDAESAFRLAEADPPEYALVDLKMPGESGLVLVRRLHALEPATRIVVLTGYASISTAIEAIKLGATHYLTKPVDADDIIAAFQRDQGDETVSVAANPLSVDRLEWEHIQRVLAEHDGNISATARALNMHRRTLQRKLSKHPPG
ncbi:MAG: response regulator transcription factor [Methylobacillus sp.]|jgi:two-component system response regulator RegA|nr:response regulator transcription factor [Methylobacillus sp.]